RRTGDRSCRWLVRWMAERAGLAQARTRHRCPCARFALVWSAPGRTVRLRLPPGIKRSHLRQGVAEMAAVPHMRAGSALPPRGDGQAVVLYQSERTRVCRMGLVDRAGTVICKEAMGPSAMARTRHEIAILERLAGGRGVLRPW